MGTWFLGPHAKNDGIARKEMIHIVDIVKSGRRAFWPDDQDFILDHDAESQEFNDSIDDLHAEIDVLGKFLANHTEPYYSPRYAAHMNSDVSMSAALGYILAQQYNQNNAAPEGGPATSYIEWRVGQQLCHMVGYNSLFEGKDEDIVGWGHITAGGTISNLESMWIARNLKYYPLALKQAMACNEPFEFIAPTFNITLCTGAQKNFYSCDPWELLNLSPTEVANIPMRLAHGYGISPEVLSDGLDKFSIQSVGKEKLDAHFKITKSPQYIISVTHHYSWPKSCAITGIGRDNLITIGVDYGARMDTALLKRELEQHLKDKHAVYCVVLIAGTTEHGAVDPLSEVFEIRRCMEKKGMSFMIHVDAAWGGYFATKRVEACNNYAFSIPLNRWTLAQFKCLREADTITVDPHKSGYVPYSAGGLLLRDGRHRFLTTWTSPFINVDANHQDISMGCYGIEGSKPGAAPVAVYLSHETIGLHTGGYADLLGTAMFNGVKMYCHWATMSLKSKTLTVTPFNMLPIERMVVNPTREEIENQQKAILELIVDKENDELEVLLENDKDAIYLLAELGSDTMINAFACNFKVGNVVNSDVIEANFLNTRLYKRFSIQSMKDDLKERPIIILRTEFKQEQYGKALDKFKSRIGLSGPENLVVLSNASMSPFPMIGQLLTEITDIFRETAEEEIQNCLVRIIEKPSIHSFVIQGINTLSLTYLSMFNIANHRRQLVVTGFISEDAMDRYTEARKRNPGVMFTIHTTFAVLSDLKKLDQILIDKKFTGDIYEGFPGIYGSSPLLKDIEFTITTVHINQSLDRKYLGHYPTEMPFTLWGTSKEYHIDHILKRAPNAQLTASGVTLDISPPLDDFKMYTLTFDQQIEWSMQPFTCRQPPAFFKPKATLNVTVYSNDSTSVSKGTLTLPQNAGDIFVDYDHLNEEIAADLYVMVPIHSEKSEKEIEADIDEICTILVTLFHNEEITWTMNIPSAIRRKLPVAKEYSVTLGAPSSCQIKPNAYFAIVSRFVGKLSSHPSVLKFAQQQALVALLEAA